MSIEELMATEFSIGYVAQTLGVSPRTIRFYEEQGLVRPARRGRERMFCTEDIRRLELVQHVQNMGFGVSEIGAFLSQSDPPSLVMDGDIAAESLRIVLDRENEFARTADLLKSHLRMLAKTGEGQTSLPLNGAA